MKPTLEEVKEYFKDAKKVVSVFGTEFEGVNHVQEFDEAWFCLSDDDYEYCLWDGKFAEIMSCKNDKPQHYTTRTVDGLDVIDLVKHWNLNFNEGNILKYLLRDKGQDKQDLEKIIDYAKRELKHLNNEEV